MTTKGKKPVAPVPSVVPVSSVSELMQRVKDLHAQMDFKPGEECFFRGHADAAWRLQPTLFRIRDDSFLSRSTGDILILEYDLFYEFRSRAKELQNLPLCDWDILFFMRHHGIPTRLLDWTESLGAALFFALEGSKPEDDVDAAIWMLNPYRLNYMATESRDLFSPEFLPTKKKHGKERTYSEVLLDDKPKFGWDIPIAIYPNQKVERMHAQRGWFTVHGDRRKPLEKMFGSKTLHEGNPSIRKPILAKITLAAGMLKEARDYLDEIGITTYMLFPDLDGLAKDLIQKYRIKM